jgi:hypothetical protein
METPEPALVEKTKGGLADAERDRLVREKIRELEEQVRSGEWDPDEFAETDTVDQPTRAEKPPKKVE